MRGFKQFLLRGNVVDLAVGAVIGAAFGTVVTALVKDLLTPLIAAIVKQPDFSALSFTVNDSKFLYGDFINALLSFLIIATAVYFFVVLPITPWLPELEKNLCQRIPQPVNVRSAWVKYLLKRTGAPSVRRRLVQTLGLIEMTHTKLWCGPGRAPSF